MTELKFANFVGYTDIRPYEIVKVVSDKCLEIREMDCEKDPSFKIDFIPGGFCGHVVNNNQQKWIITSNPENSTKRIRRHKNGNWKDAHGNRFVLDVKPKKFYDYNF